MVGRSEIKALTGVRGIAACLVVVYHLTGAGDGIPSHVLRNVVRHGYLSVDLFFILSGFVMALNYGERMRPGQVTLRSYGRFIGSRLGRTYPLYIAVTLACIAIAALGVNDFKMPDGVMTALNVLMIQSWGLADSIGGPAWSISTEFAAYLLLPLLLWFTAGGGRVRPAGTLAVVVCAYAVATTLGTSLAKNGVLDVYTSTDGGEILRCLAGFTFGLLSYRAASAPMLWRIANRPGVGGAVALAVLALLLFDGPDLLIVSLFGPLVIVLATQRGVFPRLLATPIALWLGLVSYSIYLVHNPLIRVLRSVLQPYSQVLDHYHASKLVVLLATLAVSAITYHVIERPARDLSRRWLGRAPLPSEAAVLGLTESALQPGLPHPSP